MLLVQKEKSNDRKRLTIKPKFVDRFCYYFDQFALPFSNNILWRKNWQAKKRCSKNSGKNSSFQLGTKRLGTVSRKKARKLSRTKLSAFSILFHKTQVLPRQLLVKKIFIVHEFEDSFGERLREKTSARIFLTSSSNWWISCKKIWILSWRFSFHIRNMSVKNFKEKGKKTLKLSSEKMHPIGQRHS